MIRARFVNIDDRCVLTSPKALMSTIDVVNIPEDITTSKLQEVMDAYTFVYGVFQGCMPDIDYEDLKYLVGIE